MCFKIEVIFLTVKDEYQFNNFGVPSVLSCELYWGRISLLSTTTHMGMLKLLDCLEFTSLGF